MSSMWAHPGSFDRSLLPLALYDMGTLDVTGVRFDVSGAALLWGGDSVRVVSRLMMSDDTGDGFPWQRQNAHRRVTPGVVIGCFS